MKGAEAPVNAVTVRLVQPLSLLLSLNQMNLDAADTDSMFFHAVPVTRALSYLLVLFPWFSLVGLPCMEQLELEIWRRMWLLPIPSIGNGINRSP